MHLDPVEPIAGLDELAYLRTRLIDSTRLDSEVEVVAPAAAVAAEIVAVAGIAEVEDAVVCVALLAACLESDGCPGAVWVASATDQDPALSVELGPVPAAASIVRWNSSRTCSCSAR